MKKILVLSDSHGCDDLLCAAADFVHPDGIIHLGDIVEDSECLSHHCFHLPVVRLKGNCDYGSDLPERYVDELEGVRILACHGHRYGVKSDLTALSFAGMEEKADLCLFGHTHIQTFEKGMPAFLNPGACSGSLPRCALLSLDSGTFSVDFLIYTQKGWCFF